MKPDKPPSHPTRDRDILRSRNSRSFKVTTPSTSSSTAASSSSTSEPPPSAGGTEVTTDTDLVLDSEGNLASSSSVQSSSSSSSNSEKEKGAEMKVYLDKLRELVPYVPRTGRLSRVELIHSAIDYITDLQESLEARARRKLRDKQDQSSRPPLAALSQAHVETNNRVIPLAENSSNRPPTLLETNTRHPSSLTNIDSISPEDGHATSDLNSPSRSNVNNIGEGSNSVPLIPAAPGPPPSPHDPS